MCNALQAVLKRNGVPWVEITSSFFIRGQFDDWATTFSTVIAPSEKKIVVRINDEAQAAVLVSKVSFFPMYSYTFAIAKKSKTDPVLIGLFQQSWFVSPVGVVTEGTVITFLIDSVFEQPSGPTDFAEIKVGSCVKSFLRVSCTCMHIRCLQKTESR